MEVRRNMKSNTFKEYIQPVVVLVAICLVITFALALKRSRKSEAAVRRPVDNVFIG